MNAGRHHVQQMWPGNIFKWTRQQKKQELFQTSHDLDLERTKYLRGIQTHDPLVVCAALNYYSVVAEWLGRRTLNQRVIGWKARRGIFEQDTLKSTARGSHNKQNCLRHPYSLDQ
jgi:hypothetical protein